MAVDSAYFTNFYQTLEFKPGQLVRVIGLDGIIRASWRGDASEIGQNMQGSQLFAEFVPRVPQGRYFSKGWSFDSPGYFSYRLMPDYPLVVQVGIGEEPALAEFRERRELYMAAALAGSALIILFTGMAIASARRRRQQNERWQLVVEGANDGIWDFDLKTGKRYFSDRCKAILGYLPGEFDENRQDWTEHIHPEDVATVKKARADHLQGTSASYLQTFRLCSKNGDYRWVCSRATTMRDDAGVIYRIIGTLADVHSEKEAAEALRLAQQETLDGREKYKALIEQSFEAVALLEPDTWQFLEVNRRFTDWFGYSLPEDAPLYREHLRIDEGVVLSQHDDLLFSQGYLPVQRRIFRHKNGTLVYTERSAKIIQYQSKCLVMITFRNIADQLQQEQARSQDAVIARRIQQAQLFCPPDNDFVALETLYHASGDISGDLYHLEWRNDGQVLRGYLIDVSGHALTTALYTSTLNVLLHEAADLDASLAEQVGWLNRQVSRHFESDAFAAAIAFELDLPARELRYVGAGITRFWADMSAARGPVIVTGLYLGIDQQMEYKQQSLPLAAGDRICFATDGMEWLVDGDATAMMPDCRRLREYLAAVANMRKLWTMRLPCASRSKRCRSRYCRINGPNSLL
jgi:PAS domain S-box-containing protein